jgi:hypothetical protein
MAKANMVHWAAVAVMALIAIAPWVFGVGGKSQTVIDLDKRVSSLEQTSKSDHDLLLEVRDDVKWLKQHAQNGSNQ